MENQGKFVGRINQLDAIELDKEILRILRDGITSSLKDIAPVFLVKYQPEINLLLDSSIWYLSIFKNLSTFGQQILLISYDKQKVTTSRLTLHFLLSVLPKYLKDVAEHKFTKYELIQKTINSIEHFYILLSIINFFRFLKTGKYPKLIDFILRWNCISINHGKSQKVAYNYMTRELIWAGFLEFLGVILPYINYNKLRKFLKRKLFSFNNTKSLKSTKEMMNITRINFDLTTKCCNCNQRPSHPHYIDCGHIFCYYCIHENVELDSDYCCPLCDIKVENIKRIVEM